MYCKIPAGQLPIMKLEHRRRANTAMPENTVMPANATMAANTAMSMYLTSCGTEMHDENMAESELL